MTVYVQRVGGIITGVFANAQPGYAEEGIDDGTAEVIAFRAGPSAPVLAGRARAAAISQFRAPRDVPAVGLRGALLFVLDELNALRQRVAECAADVAAATDLADLQARWAKRAPLAQLGYEDVLGAVADKIRGGDADR